jgi:hypothetical protein
MTVGDALTILEEFDEDMELMIGMQPNYPLVSKIRDIILVDDNEEDKKDTPKHLRKGERVMILEGSNVGYGDKDWWERSRDWS